MDSRDPREYQYHHRFIHRSVRDPNISWQFANQFRSLWFLGVGRLKLAASDKVERVEQSPSLPAGIAAGWYYIFAVIEPVHLPQSLRSRH
jgi:hypothetical protein